MGMLDGMRRGIAAHPEAGVVDELESRERAFRRLTGERRGESELGDVETRAFRHGVPRVTRIAQPDIHQEVGVHVYVSLNVMIRFGPCVVPPVASV